jgi:hypothetical protein
MTDSGVGKAYIITGISLFGGICKKPHYGIVFVLASLLMSSPLRI